MFWRFLVSGKGDIPLFFLQMQITQRAAPKGGELSGFYAYQTMGMVSNSWFKRSE